MERRDPTRAIGLSGLFKGLSSTLAHFSAPISPARRSIARSRCDSLKIPSLASTSGPSGEVSGSVTTALAVLPTNRLRAGSKATDHFERGIQDLILALSTCRLERRRSGCVAAMFHQCPQRAFWPPRRAPRARESGCGFGKVTSGSRHQRDISGAKRSVVPSHRGWGRATTLLSVLEVRHGSLDSTPAQD